MHRPERGNPASSAHHEYRGGGPCLQEPQGCLLSDETIVSFAGHLRDSGTVEAHRIGGAGAVK